MSLQINTFDDLLNIVNTHPEWRRRLVKALFPEIDLPKALQELVESNRLMRAQLGDVDGRLKRLDERQARLEERQIRTEEWQARTEEWQARIESRQTGMEDRQSRTELRTERIETKLGNIERDVAALKGSSYENDLIKKVDSIFGYSLRRGHNAQNEIAAKLDLAEEESQITGDEYTQVMATDLLWSGQLKQSKEVATLVIEASWFAEQIDLNRALARAAILIDNSNRSGIIDGCPNGNSI